MRRFLYEETQNCIVIGCNCTDHPPINVYYDGKKLCGRHYRQALLGEMDSLVESLDGKTEPPQRLKYLIGRYFDEYRPFVSDGKHELTQNIVKTRSFDWKKTKDRITFTVTRYPRKRTGFCVEHHRWRFNIVEKTFKFLRKCKGPAVQVD
jgi:hypothetical protein